MNDPEKKGILSLLFVAGLASAIAALVFFAWLAGEVLEGDTVLFDERARAWVHQFASPTITAVMRAFTTIGSPPVLAAVGAGGIIIMWRARWTRGAVLFAISILGAGVLDFTLKLAFRRARPEPFFNTPLPNSYSFPSGHALFSVCVFGVLAALASARARSLAIKIAWWMTAALLIALIGFSRIYLGVHYPTDVIAGYTAAFIWVITIASADHAIRRRRLRLRQSR